MSRLDVPADRAANERRPVLGGRYALTRRLEDSDALSERWLGVGSDNTRYLIKLWRYSGAEPDHVARALWDAELRTLYRIGSSPGADARSA